MKTNGIITLLTDFGDLDGYVGSMTGAILSINPNATIVNISHHIERHNIEAAAFVLSTYFHYYPEGTVHVAVVDPVVGSDRKAIAVKANKQLFIAPDNGLLSYILCNTNKWQAFEITNKELFLPNVSQTFHGRDLFAPVAAHLASGIEIDRVGSKYFQPQQFQLYLPKKDDSSIEGVVLYIDVFGNIITSIPADWLSAISFRLQIGKSIITTLSNSYSAGQKGELIALAGSSGLVEIAVNQGHAGASTGLQKGDRISISLTND
ncbi:SAM-dependent chlorinase/fluorinase [candidate division KSB1 bacterium]|nr:SAM-dependent chlorinase/fluorinase [candidate division KSB1 bacterium]